MDDVDHRRDATRRCRRGEWTGTVARRRRRRVKLAQRQELAELLFARCVTRIREALRLAAGESVNPLRGYGAGRPSGDYYSIDVGATSTENLERRLTQGSGDANSSPATRSRRGPFAHRDAEGEIERVIRERLVEDRESEPWPSGA